MVAFNIALTVLSVAAVALPTIGLIRGGRTVKRSLAESEQRLLKARAIQEDYAKRLAEVERDDWETLRKELDKQLAEAVRYKSTNNDLAVFREMIDWHILQSDWSAFRGDILLICTGVAAGLTASLMSIWG